MVGSHGRETGWQAHRWEWGSKRIFSSWLKQEGKSALVKFWKIPKKSFHQDEIFGSCKNMKNLNGWFTREAGWQVHRWEWGSSTREPTHPSHLHIVIMMKIMIVIMMNRLKKRIMIMMKKAENEDHDDDDDSDISVKYYLQTLLSSHPLSQFSRRRLKMSLLCLRACILILLVVGGAQPRTREGSFYQIYWWWTSISLDPKNLSD